jgi:bacteriocin biosynthesis cyclodehydratase domain-containing protein
MAQNESRWRIRRNYSVVVHSPDVIEFRSGVWNPVSVTLSDSSGAGKLLPIVDSFDGQRTPREVARESGASLGEVEGVIEYLVANGVIEDQPGSALDYYLYQMTTTLEDPTERGVKRLRRQRLVVLAEGRLGGMAREQLSEVEGLTIDEVGPGSPEWTALLDTRHDNREDALGQVADLDRWKGWREALLLCLLETPHPVFLRNLNRVALHLEAPLMVATIDGPFLLVGPLVVPHCSPCWECLEGRLSLSVREFASYQGYKRALAEGKVRGGESPFPRPLFSVLSGLAAMEVLNYLYTGASFTIGKVLSLYVPAGEFSFNEFLRIPACPACSPFRESTERQPYFDLRAYVNEVYVHERSRGGEAVAEEVAAAAPVAAGSER